MELFEESLRIKRLKFKSDNDKSIAITLSNIGMTYMNLQDSDKAIVKFIQSVEIY